MKLFKIKKSNIDRKGRGLYAIKDIKAGTKIIDFLILYSFINILLENNF